MRQGTLCAPPAGSDAGAAPGLIPQPDGSKGVRRSGIGVLVVPHRHRRAAAGRDFDKLKFPWEIILE